MKVFNASAMIRDAPYQCPLKHLMEFEWKMYFKGQKHLISSTLSTRCTLTMIIRACLSDVLRDLNQVSLSLVVLQCERISATVVLHIC